MIDKMERDENCIKVILYINNITQKDTPVERIEI